MDDSNSESDPVILIRLAKDGDAEAFGRLYEIYFKPVFCYIYSRVKDKETANDLVQTVFLKVFQSLERYQEKNKSPLSYFFVVARNMVIDHWRKKKEVAMDDTEKSSGQIAYTINNPLELAEKADASRILHHAISQLTEVEQEAVVLKFINDMSNREISELMGKTEEAVRQLQCRALKKLRQYLKDFKMI